MGYRSVRSRNSKKRKLNRGDNDIDVTSLLDIISILLVFLLSGFNASGINLTVPKGVELPLSQSQSLNTPGVVVQVSPEKVWVDDKELVDLTNPPARLFDHSGKRMVPLYDELVKRRLEIQEIEKASPLAKEFVGTVNLIVDKSVTYTRIKQLMYTAAEAGYRQYKFVVMGEE